MLSGKVRPTTNFNCQLGSYEYTKLTRLLLCLSSFSRSERSALSILSSFSSLLTYSENSSTHSACIASESIVGYIPDTTYFSLNGIIEAFQFASNCSLIFNNTVGFEWFPFIYHCLPPVFSGQAAPVEFGIRYWLLAGAHL